MTAELEPYLTVAQVAKRANTNKRTMLRRLIQLDKMHGGKLLRRFHPRGTRLVTLALLRELLPEIFVEADYGEVHDPLEQIRDELTGIRKAISELATALSDLRSRSKSQPQPCGY